MLFPTLFKRDSRGEIREWFMEVDGDQFRTVAGLQDGQQVTSEWTVATPKNEGKLNETTGPEQAIAEVEALYRKKLRVDYFESIEEVDKPKITKPMLADKWDKRKDKIDYSDKVWVQPKLDGIRCIASRNGLFSRTGKRIVAVPHIMESLEPLFEAHPDVILDGELYNHELHDDFDAIVSMVRKAKVTDENLDLSAKMVEYHVYDLIIDPDNGFSSRYGWLVSTLDDLKIKAPIRTVETILATNEEEVDENYEIFLEEGYEGGIIRIDGPYEKKRSKLLLKRKDFEDEEFEILGFAEGGGNWSGVAKVVFFRNTHSTSDEPGKATLKGTREYCAEVLETADEYIGKKVTVQFFGLTKDGECRFPIAKALHKEERW